MNKINFSYASKNEHNFAQRLVIRTIESLTGKRKLEKLYKNYTVDKINVQHFWQDMLSIMEIKVTNNSKIKLEVPDSVPLVVIANHPFGIIDGLVLCAAIAKKRDDFKIMTHETLQFLPELGKYILPVDFSNKRKKTKIQNIETAKKAKKHLNNNGALIIFPSGSVSTAKSLKSEAIDDEWKLFPAKLIHQTKANVLPIYFDGKNGLFFHLFASKIKNQTLKYSTYMHETKRKIGKNIDIYTGKVIAYSELEEMKSRIELTEFLKNLTYNLKKRYG